MRPGMSARVMLLSSMKRSLPVESEGTEVGRERGEGVGSDLGFAAGEGGEQGGLACVGHADEADVCDDLEFEEDELLLAFGAGQSLFDHVVVHVAFAASAAADDAHIVVLGGEVCHELALVVVQRRLVLGVYRRGGELLGSLLDQLVDHGANRDRVVQVAAVLAVATVALAGLALVTSDVLLSRKVPWTGCSSGQVLRCSRGPRLPRRRRRCRQTACL